MSTPLHTPEDGKVDKKTSVAPDQFSKVYNPPRVELAQEVTIQLTISILDYSLDGEIAVTTKKVSTQIKDTVNKKSTCTIQSFSHYIQ